MWHNKNIHRITDQVALPRATEVLPSGCAVCGANPSQLCSGCRAISYCGGEHQREHRFIHRFICRAVEKQRLENGGHAAAWRHALENYDYDNEGVTEGLLPFWDPVLLQRIHSVDSVRAQIRYYDDFGRHMFDPEFEFECGILPLLARVNEDQRMYDLTKGLFIRPGIGRSGVKNADVLEPIDFYLKSSDRAEKAVELVLNLVFLKVKILLDMMRIYAAMAVLSQKLPREIVDLVLSGISRSPTMTAKHTRMSLKDISSEIEKLRRQFDYLYARVDKLDPHFWPKLASHKLSDPVLEVRDMILEAEQTDTEIPYELLPTQRRFKRQVYAWFETPGAIALIQEKRRSENPITHE